MRNQELSRRTLLKGGGAALAGLSVLRLAGPAHAFPAATAGSHPLAGPARAQPGAGMSCSWTGSSSTPG